MAASRLKSGAPMRVVSDCASGYLCEDTEDCSEDTCGRCQTQTPSG